MAQLKHQENQYQAEIIEEILFDFGGGTWKEMHARTVKKTVKENILSFCTLK